jgi:hypothetical protein
MRFLILLCLTISCCFASAQKAVITDFMNSMKSGKATEKFISIYDELNPNSLFVNFVIVEDYAVEQIDSTKFEVLVDTGKGFYSIRLIFVLKYFNARGVWLIEPIIRNGEFHMGKQIIDPWISKERI